MWIVLFLYSGLWAQDLAPTAIVENVVIEGQVLERGTRKPLESVSVFFLPSKVKAVTDKAGFFSASVPTGPSEIVINLANYKKFSENFKFSADNKNLKLYVEKTSYDFFETTVTDLRNKRDDSQKRLTQKEFLKAPGSGGDPVKAVQNLPGVSRTGGGDSRVIIQGAEPEDTKYNIEGHEVPLVFHFGGLSSIVTPEAVGSVDYYSAAYGPEFGRALGGHVGLNVRKPKTDRTHGMVFQDLFNMGGLIEGPIDESSSYLISGRYSYIGEVLKSVAGDNKDFNLVVAPVFYDLNAQYFKKLNERDDLRVFSILSKDQLEFVLEKPIGEDPKIRGSFMQKTEFYRIIPQWTRQIDVDRRLTTSLGYGEDDIYVNVGAIFFDVQSQALSARADYEVKYSPLWKTNLGLDTTYSWYTVKVKAPVIYSQGGVSNPLSSAEVRDAEVKGDRNVLGLYFRNEIKPSEVSAWTLLPNLRVDRFSSTKETALQPRLALRYAVNSSLLLRAGTGLYYQEPSGQQTDSVFGNPDIKSQQAVHYALGFDKDFREGSSDGWTWASTLFYKNLDRMILSSGSPVIRDGKQTTENYANKGTGNIRGLENQLKLQKDLWGATLSYTYLESRRKSPGARELPSAYDQTHSVNLLASYKAEKWEYGTRLRYVTGNPVTPIIGSYYDADNDIYTPQRGDIFSQREKPFFQVDLRIDRKWVYDTWILSGYLDVQNVSMHKNQVGTAYSYDYSEKKEITGLPILPTFGLKGEF